MPRLSSLAPAVSLYKRLELLVGGLRPSKEKRAHRYDVGLVWAGSTQLFEGFFQPLLAALQQSEVIRKTRTPRS